jgi:uncharacterized protein YyaL (SSP411 family)
LSNKLIYAASPYLQQHAQNPVHWQEWSAEAWLQAVAEDKLVLVSIGYSACHWCHVMEHECFEDKATAEMMNALFVNIKVDREERPDVDQVYMDACQLINQSGGWPLNVFCLPDGRPIHAGTYFPKKSWQDMLTQLAMFYETRKEEAQEYASKLTQGIANLDKLNLNEANNIATPEYIHSVVEKWKTSFDPMFGGYNWAPKFPMPSNYSFFLHQQFNQPDEVLKFQVQQTLTKMALGGIYDQAGGGFARYSVDAQWMVPHFEKMLYDNAQLVSLYTHAWQTYKSSLYKTIVEETIAFVERELTSPEGLFYSGLDADSEGVEGKFYIFTYDEINQALGSDAEFACEYYQITTEGNWEHGNNILLAADTLENFAEKKSISIAECIEKIHTIKARLFAFREPRIRPGLDDKCVTSWNALMIKSYIDAGMALGNEVYIQRAKHAADFILQNLYMNGRLMRIYKSGTASIPAFLEDEALLADALIHLYQATGDEIYIRRAQEIVENCFSNFYDHESGMFFFKSSLDEALIVRKLDITDDVIPSANSTMALVLYKLGYCVGEQKYIDTSAHMLSRVSDQFLRFPTGYSNWMELALIQQRGLVQVSLPHPSDRKKFAAHHLPHILWIYHSASASLPIVSEKAVHATDQIFVCRDKTCYQPVIEFEDALKQILS